MLFKKYHYLFIVVVVVAEDEMAGPIARMGEKRNSCRILVGKSEGKRQLGRPRLRWVGSAEVDFRDKGWSGMDWIDLAQDRDQWRALLDTVMNLLVP
jgi:hypothetical protein